LAIGNYSLAQTGRHNFDETHNAAHGRKDWHCKISLIAFNQDGVDESWIDEGQPVDGEFEMSVEGEGAKYLKEYTSTGRYILYMVLC